MSYYIFFIVHFCQHVHVLCVYGHCRYPYPPFYSHRRRQILGIFARRNFSMHINTQWEARSWYARGENSNLKFSSIHIYIVRHMHVFRKSHQHQSMNLHHHHHHSPNFEWEEEQGKYTQHRELLMNFITVPFSTASLVLIPSKYVLWKLKMSESSLSGAVKFCKRIVPSSSFVHSRKCFMKTISV